METAPQATLPRKPRPVLEGPTVLPIPTLGRCALLGCDTVLPLRGLCTMREDINAPPDCDGLALYARGVDQPEELWRRCKDGVEDDDANGN